MWPFEGNHYADVAPGENEFDTPGLEGPGCLGVLGVWGPEMLCVEDVSYIS
jgi:hypothetical protein